MFATPRKGNKMWTEDFILKMIGVAGAGGLLLMVIWRIVKVILEVRKGVRTPSYIIYRRDTPEWQAWAEDERQKGEERYKSMHKEE